MKNIDPICIYTNTNGQRLSMLGVVEDVQTGERKTAFVHSYGVDQHKLCMLASGQFTHFAARLGFTLAPDDPSSATDIVDTDIWEAASQPAPELSFDELALRINAPFSNPLQ